MLVSPVTPGDRLGRIDRALAARRTGPVMSRAAFLAAGAALTRPRVPPPARAGSAGLRPAALVRGAARLAQFLVEQRALFDDLPALAGAIGVPVAIVVATRDRVIDLPAARRYATETGARLTELPGAGHLLPMQRPAEVADAIAAVASTYVSCGAR